MILPRVIKEHDTIIMDLVNVKELLIIAETINKESKIQKLILENQKDFELIIKKKEKNDI